DPADSSTAGLLASRCRSERGRPSVVRIGGVGRPAPSAGSGDPRRAQREIPCLRLGGYFFCTGQGTKVQTHGAHARTNATVAQLVPALEIHWSLPCGKPLSKY